MNQPLDPEMLKLLGHEARRPLVSLINTADLLLAGLEGELTEQVYDDVGMLRENAQTALARLDDLLALLVKQP